MAEHSLFTQGWRFKFDKSTRRFGYCRDDKVISLSAALVQLNPAAEVEQIILHEIAHAVVGNQHHHNDVWRRKAIELGHSGNRCYSSAVVKPERKEPRWVQQMRAKRTPGYVAPKQRAAVWSRVCPACGKRTPAKVRRANSRIMSCGRCSPGRFNPAFILKWERNI